MLQTKENEMNLSGHPLGGSSLGEHPSDDLTALDIHVNPNLITWLEHCRKLERDMTNENPPEFFTTLPRKVETTEEILELEYVPDEENLCLSIPLSSYNDTTAAIYLTDGEVDWLIHSLCDYQAWKYRNVNL